MTAVGVIGRKANEWAHIMTQLRHGGDDTVRITCLQEAEAPARVNVLVALDASPLLARAASLLVEGDYLLVNADARNLFAALPRGKAGLITFGFNGKACITASSVTEGAIQVCIQRGFYTVGGVKREPQEFAAPYPSGASASVVLGAVAACVLCDAW